MSIELTPAVLARHAILYVDDNEWSRTVFAKTVRSFVAVDLADSPEHAFEMLRARPYSIVVTDLLLPGMDGIDLCVTVRRRFPKVRRILVTAYGDLETAADAINRGGISHFVTKPWKADFLVHAIREILTRVELERTVESLQEDIRKREIEIALGEQFGRIVHDLSGIPLPIRTTLMDLSHVVEHGGLPDAAKEIVSQQCKQLDLVIEHLEAILRTSRDLRLRPPCRRRYQARTALETARALVSNRSDRTHIELACDDPRLEFMADLTDVTRVLVNLLVNAQNALRDTDLDGHIVMRAYREGPETMIEVADNGPGVPPDRRDAIFERGYTERKERGGLGLGLTICRDLAVMNGGSLSLESNDRRGCRFVLRLPAPPIADRTSA